MTNYKLPWISCHCAFLWLCLPLYLCPAFRFRGD